MNKRLIHIGFLTTLLLTIVGSVYADTSIISVYDTNGNLVTGDGRYYEYNDANQLVRVRQGDTIAGPVIAEYFYDYSGQRVKKIENGVVTYYVGKHFEKQVGGANEGSTSYYFGEGGDRVAKKDPTGNIYYYHLDHLDGINAVTDSTGTVVARTDYLPFGDTRAGSSGSEKYSYTGKEMDKTSLYYFDARYNSPQFRHFTQADIAEPEYDDPQDLNRYSYVGNNPLSYVDYDGFKKHKKKHLSKREQRARSLGLNPDKDKYKVGKMSDKEYKKALAAHKAASKSKNATASSSSYQLSVGGSVGGNVQINDGVSEKEHEYKLRLKIANLNAYNASQLAVDANNSYIEQIDYATKFFKVVKWSADLGLLVYGAGASSAVTGVKALYSGATNGLTLYQAFNKQLSTKEILGEAAKLTVGAAIGDTGTGEAVSFGFDTAVDLWE